MRLHQIVLPVISAALVAFSTAAGAAWPDRPIQLIVPWAAGGGTDATARIIGRLLENQIGQPVNVVNKPGGNGVVGYQAILDGASDGYTIGMLDSNITALHYQGLTELSPEKYAGLALVNQDPEAVIVSSSGPYDSVATLLEALRSGKTLTASGAGEGSIGQLGIVGLLKERGIDIDAVTWVPSKGAAPALIELAAGGVDIVIATLPEGRSMIESGKAKALALLSDTPAASFPDVPLLGDVSESTWTIGLWRGIAAPGGISPEVRSQLEAALHDVVQSTDYTDFMAKQGYGVAYLGADDFDSFMEDNDRKMGELLDAIGLRKR